MAPLNLISAVSFLGNLQGIADSVSETSPRLTVILCGVQIPSVFVLEYKATLAFFVKHSFLFLAALISYSLLVNVVRQGISWLALVRYRNPTAHAFHDRAVCVSVCVGVLILIIFQTTINNIILVVVRSQKKTYFYYL